MIERSEPQFGSERLSGETPGYGSVGISTDKGRPVLIIYTRRRIQPLCKVPRLMGGNSCPASTCRPSNACLKYFAIRGEALESTPAFTSRSVGLTVLNRQSDLLCKGNGITKVQTPIAIEITPG